jgi:hypothetical protein
VLNKEFENPALLQGKPGCELEEEVLCMFRSVLELFDIPNWVRTHFRREWFGKRRLIAAYPLIQDS